MDDEAVNAPPSQGASQRKHLGLPMHTWISIGIASGVLLLTYLLWRNSRASGASVAAGGQGIPNFGAAGSGLGDASGDPTVQAELAAIMAYIANHQTPNPAPPAPTPSSGGGINPGGGILPFRRHPIDPLPTGGGFLHPNAAAGIAAANQMRDVRYIFPAS